MDKKVWGRKKGIILSVICVSLFVVLCTYWLTVNNENRDDFKDEYFPPISDAVGIIIDYQSRTYVNSYADIEAVFNEYIEYSQTNDLDIFGLSNNWRYDNASIHGIYQGVRYFQVNASWYDDADQQWHLKAVFDVSENGDVVRLLGPIY